MQIVNIFPLQHQQPKDSFFRAMGIDRRRIVLHMWHTFGSNANLTSLSTFFSSEFHFFIFLSILFSSWFYFFVFLSTFFSSSFHIHLSFFIIFIFVSFLHLAFYILPHLRYLCLSFFATYSLVLF